MAVAKKRNTREIRAIKTCIDRVHRSHLGYAITVRLKAISKRGFVGKSILENPSPKPKARTAV